MSATNPSCDQHSQAESDISTVTAKMDQKFASPPQDADDQANEPTLSHQLASGNSDQPQHGAAQVMHDGVKVQDLGWDEDSEDYAELLIGDLSNEELWTLVRRFNKQMFHVKATDQPMASSFWLGLIMCGTNIFRAMALT